MTTGPKLLSPKKSTFAHEADDYQKEKKKILSTILLLLHPIQCTLTKYICSPSIFTCTPCCSNTFKPIQAALQTPLEKKKHTHMKRPIQYSCEQIRSLDKICRYLYCLLLPRYMAEFNGKLLCHKYSLWQCSVKQLAYSGQELLYTISEFCQTKKVITFNHN